VEYKTSAQRWIINTVSAGEEETIKREVLNSIEEMKTHLESPPVERRKSVGQQYKEATLKLSNKLSGNTNIPTATVEVPRNQGKIL
jgi:hypothetical protein